MRKHQAEGTGWNCNAGFVAMQADQLGRETDVSGIVASIGRKPSAILVRCLECGRGFSTRSNIPECPKCGGSDVELQ